LSSIRGTPNKTIHFWLVLPGEQLVGSYAKPFTHFAVTVTCAPAIGFGSIDNALR
jgi:hypothetical protein